MSIEHIQHLPNDPQITNALNANEEKAEKGGFGKILKEYISDVNAMQQDMDNSIEDLATGKVQDLHQVMIAVEKADVSFRLMMEVRNKLVKAYEEVMKMQV